jgi:hypothetical protein
MRCGSRPEGDASGRSESRTMIVVGHLLIRCLRSLEFQGSWRAKGIISRAFYNKLGACNESL